MKFNQLLVKISATDNQNYGYKISFGSGLNIVRGDNSSGKSTFVNSLIYALGMEEVVGAKGNVSLPYALKDHFYLNGEERQEKRILSSSVFLELENGDGKIITLKRAIISDEVDTKIIQVIDGPYLSGNSSYPLQSIYTFLHDPGSAQDPEKGFYAYFEKFLGLALPNLSDNKGRETKLYLQSVFAALLIEQKRGWTDYIANIPYYGISSMREKVASFLLDLDSFRNAKKLSKYQSVRSDIISQWSEIVTELKGAIEGKQFSISGLNKAPTIDFDEKLVLIGERTGVDIKPLETVRVELASELIRINKEDKDRLSEEPKKIVDRISNIQDKIGEYLLLQEICGKRIKINESQLKQYEDSLTGINKDLKANKLTEKLVKFGVDEANLNVAKGRCATCFNILDDILISPDSLSMPMSLEENITHLNNQKKMTQSLIDGLNKDIGRDKSQLLTINNDIYEMRKELVSLKRDIRSTNSVTETDIRRKIILETRQEEIVRIENKVENALTDLRKLSVSYKEVIAKVASLSKYQFSHDDINKINSFSNNFKELANKFGYRSADVSDIEIKAETLLPYLQGIELRETKSANFTADIKTDSSASDFVRLIWSYLISLYKVSALNNGNHLGVLLFDEPAQHSMSTKSVNEMLKTLSLTKGLQSIVAASFDENDETFNASINGLNVKDYKFIRLSRKIIEIQ